MLGPRHLEWRFVEAKGKAMRVRCRSARRQTRRGRLESLPGAEACGRCELLLLRCCWAWPLSLGACRISRPAAVPGICSDLAEGIARRRQAVRRPKTSRRTLAGGRSRWMSAWRVWGQQRARLGVADDGVGGREAGPRRGITTPRSRQPGTRGLEPLGQQRQRAKHRCER